MAEDLKGLKVLIVEDEWLVAMNLEAALEHAGIQVIGRDCQDFRVRAMS